ncbi:hypothetical protein [Delftia sp. PS-11]|uniref:hypothetical protein n=1 Tax=Delftia sp. PS-11 TaxID=2767222 RepID=UPI002457DF11|nr:hypothetical protein [Delftia sp. PS-11]KAJ8746183.1 hypothetical protein H9T68_03495 [Delftia sp. PS-11]
MSQTKEEIGLAVALRSPLLLQRFETLFADAAARSLRHWRQVPLVSAQVLIVDGQMPEPEAAAWTPCVIYVGGAPQGLGQTPQRWAASLGVDFAAADLVDALDRAAVFLMDWRVRQQLVASQALERALADLQRQGADCMYRFQLSAWVALPAPWNRAECLRALAMLCRGPMDIPALCEHSGISCETAIELLQQPGLRSLLHCSLRSVRRRTATTPLPEGGTNRHWVRRLAGWVLGQGSAA